ncbi:MAG: flagellar basal body L-ring protein FlgH [Desulfovibrio sp.]|jgi:flagellar L-ring protein precursor FlgH|nr:flagellar basal body L-ring protein FlgH [Desulfovibrio sp.]
MKRRPRFLSLSAITGLCLLAAGCGGGPQAQYAAPMPPITPTQQYTEPEQRYSNPGSLYSASEATDLYADNRAHRVGDIILIKVVENSKSKSKADTTAQKQSSHSLGVAAAFGRNTIGVIPGMGGPLTGNVGVDPMLSTSTASGLSATGETKRENYVTATVGARVLQVLPSGVLQVQGAREIRVNDETQYMVISGLVRSQDVASDNSVDSTQLADSRIEYYGKGDLTNKQRQGWLSRMLDNIWPF